MKLIRITRETCPACIILKEIMSRIMDDYPDVEIIDYDERLDEEKCNEYPHESVPFLICGEDTLVGGHKSFEIREFIEKCLEKYNK